MRGLLVTSLILLSLQAALMVYGLTASPDTVPAHFDSGGQVTETGSKWQVFPGPVLASVIVVAAAYSSARNTGFGRRPGRSRRLFGTIWIGVVAALTLAEAILVIAIGTALVSR
ncbi:DUF1648 domain-containing protein [Microbispora sp. CA-135349]|uniref:DUF1648 domain-containing protein n=1 Tax=Microbispora sp. CA-135349 TaxID=3239953 RepID=UPI003D945F47